MLIYFPSVNQLLSTPKSGAALPRNLRSCLAPAPSIGIQLVSIRTKPCFLSRSYRIAPLDPSLSQVGLFLMGFILVVTNFVVVTNCIHWSKRVCSLPSGVSFSLSYWPTSPPTVTFARVLACLFVYPLLGPQLLGACRLVQSLLGLCVCSSYLAPDAIGLQLARVATSFVVKSFFGAREETVFSSKSGTRGLIIGVGFPREAVR